MINLPSFSDANYRIAGYVATALISVSGVFLCYEMIVDSGWEIEAEWNMFKSWMIWPLYVIGLVVAIGNIGKSHYSQDTIIETEYRDGRVTREKSNDIIDVMFGHIFLPLLGHFVLEPLVIAALIYYPLMCVVALLGQLVPYILTVVVLAVCFGAFKFTALVDRRSGSVIVVVATLMLTAGFGYGGYAIRADNSPTGTGAKGFVEGDTATVATSEAEENVQSPTTTDTPVATDDEFDDAPATTTTPTTAKPSTTTTDDEFDDAPAKQKPTTTDDEF